MHLLGLACSAGMRLPLYPGEIRRLLLCMLQKLAPEGAEVELAFVRDAEIMDLNQRFLDCRGPTNCLSFPDAEPGGTMVRGSLVVSLDTLYRECLLHGQSPAGHLSSLLAHGLAHLAGFRHGKEMDAVCVELEKCREKR